MTESLSITKGKGLDNAQGVCILIPKQTPVQALATTLSSVALAREAWWSPYIWVNNYRSGDNWVSSMGVTLDLDHDSPPEVIPPPEESQALNDLASNPKIMPGSLWHATPRGGRIVAVFKEQCFNKKLFSEAASGFAYLVAQVIIDLPFSIDPQAVDLARLFFVPNTFAKKKQRSAKVITLRESPFTPEELAAFAPKENPVIVVPNPNRSYSDEREKTDWDYAVLAWNKDHPEKYPSPKRRELCPVCKDPASFCEFKFDSTRWSCFSTYHNDTKIGRKGPSDISFFGDALDMEAFRRGKTRSQVLRKDGYWPAPNQHIQKQKTEAEEESAEKEWDQPMETPPPFDELEEENTLSILTEVSNGNNGFHNKSSESFNAKPPIPPSPPERPVIQLSTEIHQVVDKTISALGAAPELYQRGCVLSTIMTAKRAEMYGIIFGEHPAIKDVSSAYLEGLISKYTKLVKIKKTKDHEEWVSALPPDWLVRGVYSRGVWEGVRPLEGIIEAPIMRLDGTVLDTPGYDEKTGLVFTTSTKFEKVKDAPTKEEAKQAAEELLKLVCDFPFCEIPGSPNFYQSAWLSALLTPFVRASIPTAPMFLIDSNVRGSGKSMLCDIISTIANGRPMPRTVNPYHEEEFKKLVTSFAVSGTTMVLIDNITGQLGSQALDAVLTAPTWKDRILGKSEVTAEIPMAIVWFATGNNVELKGDLCRRIIHIRLKSDDEMPETRQEFKNPNLMETVRTRRAYYVNCALTVLRAFSANKPTQPEMRAIDFKQWSYLVRGALVWLGYPDPGETQNALGENDSDRGGLVMLISALEKYPKSFEGVTTSEIIRWATPVYGRDDTNGDALREALGELCPSRDGKLPSALTLGKRLGVMRSRVVNNMCIEYDSKEHKNIRHWRIVFKKIPKNS